MTSAGREGARSRHAVDDHIRKSDASDVQLLCLENGTRNSIRRERGLFSLSLSWFPWIKLMKSIQPWQKSSLNIVENINMSVETLESVQTETEWHNLRVGGVLPKPRFNHAVVTAGRRMFVYGGISSRGILHDVHVLHAESLVWTELGWKCPAALGDVQKPRSCGRNMVYWEKKLVVLGVDELKTVTVNIFDLDTHAWSIPDVKGEIPSARSGQSVVLVGSMLIMLGGEDMNGDLHNDIQILDLRTLVWLPSSTRGARPTSRRDHTAVCYEKRYLWTFGGKSKSAYLSDVHCIDLQTMEWQRCKVRGKTVVGRAGHTSVIVGNKWYIVGGLSDGKEVSETLSFNLETHSWSLVTSVPRNSPLANDGISVVRLFHKGRSFLMTYGGHSPAPCNQIYVMLLPPVVNSSQRPQKKHKPFALLRCLLNSESQCKIPYSSGSSITSSNINFLKEGLNSSRREEDGEMRRMIIKEDEGDEEERMKNAENLKVRLFQAVRINSELREEIAEVMSSNQVLNATVRMLVEDKHRMEADLSSAFEIIDELRSQS